MEEEMSKFTLLIMLVYLSFGLAQAQEMIIDGTFDSDSGAWLVEANDGGALFFEMMDGQAHIIIDGIGANPWSSQFKQKIAITSDMKYDISFDIYSTGTDSIGVWIQQDHPDWIIFDEKTFYAYDQWQHISYTTDEEVYLDDEDAKLTFVFKEVELGDEIYIDNVSMSEEGTLIGINDDFANQSLKFSLSQNYPNPFNPETKIPYTITKQCMVKLELYDILGCEVAILVNEVQQPGAYTINFNAEKLVSGFYFYTLYAGENISHKRMLLLK